MDYCKYLHKYNRIDRYKIKNSWKVYTGIEGLDYVECKLCGKRSLIIDKRHLSSFHHISKKEYLLIFPNAATISKIKIETQKNNAVGNQANKGKRFSDEHCSKISKAQKGMNNSFFGRTHKKVSMERRRNTLLQLYGKPVYNKYTIEDVENFLFSINYKLVSNEYIDSISKITIKCDEGHIYSTRFDTVVRGCRCPLCMRKHSRSELEVYEFLKSYFTDVELGNRKLIAPYELDIVIPSKKAAVEYCGLYWHGESQGKDKNYHLNKLKRCNEKGYRLITIFEDEWIYKRDIVKSRLRNILGVSNCERIYARKCVIREIENKHKNIFLMNNHIQGSDTAYIKLGAYFNNKLVSVMTFSKGNIAKGGKSVEDVYELNRFCSDKNVLVIGAASKLLKYFISNYSPKKIFTYGDKRWSEGGLYKSLMFRFVTDTDPNYWYVINGKRAHRFNFRKSVLKDKLGMFDVNKTEYQNMLFNGYDRIWDCGNSKWELVLNS